MAKAFMGVYRAGIVRGLFLSSGVAGSIRTQDQLIATAEILREKYHFEGYIHLKIMPGSEFSQVKQAMRLANRVSINLEAPNPDRLKKLAPHKAFFEELIQPLMWAAEIRRESVWNRPASVRQTSITTQFVVGAAGESDWELLSTTDRLFREYHLGRIYYSAFNPIPDTPVENLPSTPPIREHRLYQASMLLKHYGFSLADLAFRKDGNLDHESDPKEVWAMRHLSHNPVEINTASRSQLLRIPGIGPKGATNILITRKQGKIKALSELRRLGVNPSRMVNYVLLDGKRPERQKSFWAM